MLDLHEAGAMYLSADSSTSSACGVASMASSSSCRRWGLVTLEIPV